MAKQQEQSATTQKAEREVSRMVVVMVGSFCLCYVPYAALAMYMVNNRNHGLDLRLVTIPAFFSKSACVYNPIIYCFMNKQVPLGTPRDIWVMGTSWGHPGDWEHPGVPEDTWGLRMSRDIWGPGSFRGAQGPGMITDQGLGTKDANGPGTCRDRGHPGTRTPGD